MAATFAWQESNGGSISLAAAAQVNWKNIDDIATAYNAAGASIIEGARSFEKWQCGKFTTGTFTEISVGKYSHTAGATDANCTLYGSPGADVAMRSYAQPVKTASAAATVDISGITAIASGALVYFGATNPEPSGKGTTADGTVDRYSNWIVTQLDVAVGQGAGPIGATLVLTMRYDET